MKLRKTWEGKIQQHYETGRNLLHSNPRVQQLEEFIEQLKAEKRTETLVPDVFLEALTFEDTFLRRMLSVL